MTEKQSRTAVRQCAICKKYKPLNKFQNNAYSCRLCHKKNSKQFILNSDQKIVKYLKKSKQRITPHKKYNEKEIQQLIQEDIIRDDLHYIKGILASSYKKAGIPLEEITPDMIELKRIQLKFYREIKKGKEVINEIYKNV